VSAIEFRVVQALQTVFGGGSIDLAARRTGFRQRESKLTGSVFVQTLVFGWLHNPQATLEDLAQAACNLGVPLSPQGLEQRFGPRAAALLQQILQNAVMQVISANPAAVPLLQRFTGGVSLLDTTTLALPAAFARAWPGSGSHKKPAAMKAQVRLDLLDGTLTGPALFPAREHDQTGTLHTSPLRAGALQLADIGFFSLERLRSMHEQNIFWLTRVPIHTLLEDTDGKVWTLANFLRSQSSDHVDALVFLGGTERLPCRFLAMRVPPAVVSQRRRRWRKRGQRRGSKPHPDRDYLAHWNFWVTNIAADKLTLNEAWVLARCRWQIELLFKLWKSEGHIDESRSGKPWRILCEIHAKLIGMVVQHWLLLVGCWSHSNRSLRKASRTVRMHAMPLALVLGQRHLVCGILLNVRRCLAVGCRVNCRHHDPPTHQLLSGLPEAA
jgi:Transposase DDE domain